MSYQNAIECFDNVKKYISQDTDSETSRALFDLSSGLAVLVNTIQNDIASLKQRIDLIAIALKVVK